MKWVSYCELWRSEGFPSMAEQRGVLAKGLARRAATYLDDGVCERWMYAGVTADVFDRTRCVPLGWCSDGTWVWPKALAHYVREHQVGLPEALLDHMRAQDFVAPECSEAEVREQIRRIRVTVHQRARRG
ncbi:MAG: hypothetical protein R3A52_27265 [Polyangiales bacterium]